MTELDRSEMLRQTVRERLAEAGADAVESMIETLTEGLKVEKVVNADIHLLPGLWEDAELQGSGAGFACGCECS